eukprot:CAMPEP_0181331302 /NCGR_PEP_ID=MMETSP1101-20121128/24422_1 /TAXON_ID=46948 /ORGANISM="Rhodomonas abbreviata, Strain Caron Lab Isolate" /LENGTH=194 /DNA_ID=CAMNT_0023440739 /DNA_START=266 /DNA_END=847 /DNA_ORIENTATION=+
MSGTSSSPQSSAKGTGGATPGNVPTQATASSAQSDPAAKAASPTTATINDQDSRIPKRAKIGNGAAAPSGSPPAPTTDGGKAATKTGLSSEEQKKMLRERALKSMQTGGKNAADTSKRTKEAEKPQGTTPHEAAAPAAPAPAPAPASTPAPAPAPTPTPAAPTAPAPPPPFITEAAIDDFLLSRRKKTAQSIRE